MRGWIRGRRVTTRVRVRVFTSDLAFQSNQDEAESVQSEARQQPEETPVREEEDKKLRSIKEMSKRFESVESSALNQVEDQEQEAIEDRTDEMDQEEIMVVENHATVTDLEDMQERSSVSRSVDIGVQVKFEDAINRDQRDQEATTEFPDTTVIEETEVINSHTIKVAEEFDPRKPKFFNPIIKNRVE